jgi:hypothetical protein
LLAAVPDADVLTVWHIGFDGLDTFGGILRALRRPVAARVVVEAHPRAGIPAGEGFVRWLDGQWARLDRIVDAEMTTTDAGGA